MRLVILSDLDGDIRRCTEGREVGDALKLLSVAFGLTAESPVSHVPTRSSVDYSRQRVPSDLKDWLADPTHQIGFRALPNLGLIARSTKTR